MERAERETIIILNRADMAEGYFVFGTSEAGDFRKLCKRIGGQDNLIELDASADWWECRVPVKYISKATWAIGKKRRLTPKQKIAARERLQRAREASNAL